CRLRHFVGQFDIVSILEMLLTVRSFQRGKLGEIDKDRHLLILAAPQRESRAAYRLDREAHHRLIDAAYLLDIERAVRQPLAIKHQQIFEEAEDAAVRHWRGRNPAAKCVLAEEERIDSGIEQIAATAHDEAATTALVDEPEEDEDPRPGAAA